MLGKSRQMESGCLMQSMHGTAVSERMASMRLCDLDEIKVCVDRQYENCHGYSGSKKAIYREAILAVKSILHSAKPVDAVPVVRCRECKYWQDNNDGYPHQECRWGNYETPDPDDYCSYGERSKENVNA